MMKSLPKLACLLALSAIVAAAPLAAQNSGGNNGRGKAASSAVGKSSGGSRAASQNYRLLVRDQIEVTVFNEPDLTVVSRIDGQGQVRLQLIENVVVAGKSVREAEDLIAKLYVEKKFLRNPMVTVRVTEYSPREVMVFGQVMTPSAVPFPIEVDQMDLLEVITKCGGFTDLAKPKEVRVTRVGSEGEQVVNVEAMYRGGAGERVVVYPGDTVFVPRAVF